MSQELSTYDIIRMIGYFIPMSILVVFSVGHSYNIYHDLFTTARKSVDHRNVNPPITPLYRAKAYCILLSMMGYIVWMASVMAAAGAFEFTAFMTLFFVSSIGFFVAKSSQYAVFMMRLHHTYGQTKFAYPRWVLMAIAMWGFLGTISLPIVLFVHWLPSDPDVDDILMDDKDRPDIDMPPLYIAPYALTEFGIQIAVFIMFLVPLKKTINDLRTYENDGTLNVAGRQKAKVIFVSSKVFVLAATASVSSVLAFFLLAAGVNDLVFCVDAVVNVICLMLLSPYYCGPKGNEHRLYRVICRPMIFCFCQHKRSLEYHKEKKRKRNSSGVVTQSQTDTESAMRVYAGNKTAANVRQSITETETVDMTSTGGNLSERAAIVPDTIAEKAENRDDIAGSSATLTPTQAGD